MITTVDFGHAYLAKVLAHAVAAAKADGNEGKVVIHDHGQQLVFAATPEGILEAAVYSSEVDGLLSYRVHRATFVVLYDGPYDQDNAPEIINDGNERSTVFTDLANAEWEA